MTLELLDLFALVLNVPPYCQGARRTVPGVLHARLADFLPDAALPRIIQIWLNAGGVL